MKRVVRIAGCLSAVMLGSMLSGCVFLGDLLNPSVANSLGIPGPAQTGGSFLVRLQNDSQVTANMAVVANYALAIRTTSTGGLAPGESTDYVYDCPVGLIRPAGIAAGERVEGEMATASAAASVFGTDGMTVDITYVGVDLVPDTVFFCGDLIQIRLVQTGTEVMAENFSIVVEIFRGS